MVDVEALRARFTEMAPGETGLDREAQNQGGQPRGVPGAATLYS